PGLIRALPNELREQISKLSPSGDVSAKLNFQWGPGLTSDNEPRLTGEVTLEGVSADVLALAPESQRFSKERLQELRGKLCISDDTIDIGPLHGEFFKAKMQLAGRLN